MKIKKWSVEKLLGILMLLFAVGFNLWIYRLEPTAVIDPNDNTFQFGLVDRTNTVWGYATKQCSASITGILTYPICHFSYMADHWVHNWAQGYNLPYYYSHIPQILIVGSWRMLSIIFHQLTLFQYYHIVIYLLLCVFPLPVFFALRVAGFSWLTAGIGALLATHLSTDGLYGLDPSSFLWRGYGLSSQLFAMIWLPLAIAYGYRYFMTSAGRHAFSSTVTQGMGSMSGSNSLPDRRAAKSVPTSALEIIMSRDLFFGVLFTVATTAGHLGIGMITFMSLGFLAISPTIQALAHQQWDKKILEQAIQNVLKLVLLAGISIFILSYWIIPTFIHGNYHNISFWDPVWKFDSYGWETIIGKLWNGELFDWGRLPILTYLIFTGVFAGLIPEARIENKELRIKNKDNDTLNSQFLHLNSKFPFAMLFVFWLVFYFGRTTWGGLIDLIPGMKEYHLSRFLVGLHIAGIFLAPIGIQFLADQGARITDNGLRKLHIRLNHSLIRLFVYSFISLLLLPLVYQWTLTYNELNDRLIVQANGNRAKVQADEEALFAKLRSLPPGRIYAGRGATYGKRFEIAETPYYMHLSTYGLPTVLWLPETWSMNSDTEQYFSDDQPKDYDLYNIRYIAAPPDEAPKPFWKFIDQAPTWKLYEVQTSGYFTTGVRPAIVSTDKRSFVNVVHLWIQSDAHKRGLFPELTFDKGYPKTSGLPNFRMTDEATYKVPDGTLQNVFAQPPSYMLVDDNNAPIAQPQQIALIGPETNDTDMRFSTKVEVPKSCRECIVVLKHTFVPGWNAYVDGKVVRPFAVFPFFIGVPISEEGTHEVIVRYEPSKLKVGLLVLTSLVVIGIGAWYVVRLRVRKGN